MTTTVTEPDTLARTAEEIRRRQRFVIASHIRPDGDAIGSQLAMAYALRALGKQVRIVNRDPAPAPLMAFPGVADIEIAAHVEGRLRNAMPRHEFAREGLAALEARGRLRGPEHREAGLAQPIGDPVRERLLGPDHD